MTLEDLAYLLEDLSELSPGGVGERFLEFVRTDPRLSPIYQQLEALARDAGYTEPGAFSEALDLHRMVDLLEAGDGRLSPRRVLEATDEDWEEYLDLLIRVVEARAARASEPRKLLAVKKKLETAQRKFKVRYGLA